MAYSLDQLRQLYPDVLGSLSDAAAINKISSLSGQDPQALASHYGVIDPNQGDLARGWGSGIDSAQAGLYGVAAWAMGDNVPEGSVREKVRDWGYKGYEDNMAEVQLRAKPYDTITEAKSFGDVVDSAQYWLAYAGPQIIEAVLGSKGGAFVGKKTVEHQVKKELKKKLGNNTGAINAVLNSKATKELVSKWSTRGSYGGIGTQAIATELGHTYGGAVDEAIAKGGTIDDVDWGRATKYGLAAGAAEFGADVLTLGLAKVGPAKDLMRVAGKGKSRVRNALTRGITGGTLEAGTEMVQTGLEEMGAGHSFKNANFLDPTSAWAGFIGGGAMGLAGGAATKKPDTKAQIDEALEIANQESQEADQERQQQERQQQQQQQSQEQNIDELEELRDTHSRTFPDEKTWTAEQKAEQELMDRAELADEESELSAEFKKWRKANRIHLSNNEKANDKVIKDFFKASAGSVSNQQMRDAHIAALDAHADLQVQKANRTEDQQAMINETLDEMIADRSEALDTGNMEMLRTVEQQAIDLSTESPEFMAEWSEAKRIWAQAQAESDAEVAAKTKKTKGRKTKKATEELEIETEETPVVTEETPVVTEETPVETIATEGLEEAQQQELFETGTGPVQPVEEPAVQPVEEVVKEEYGGLETPVPETDDQETAPGAFNAPGQETLALQEDEYKLGSKASTRWGKAVREFERKGENAETNHPELFDAIKAYATDKVYDKKLKEARETQELMDSGQHIREVGARLRGQFRIKGGSWQEAIINLLEDASIRGALGDYMRVLPTIKHRVKKGDTRENIAEKYNLKVEDIFPPTEKVKKKVKVKGTGTSVKNPPRYTIEYKDSKKPKRPIIGTQIDIPVSKKVLAALPIEERYKAVEWFSSRISDDIGFIDETTNKPYTSAKGKKNVDDALRSYRKKHVKVGADPRNIRERMESFMEKTAFAESFSGNITEQQIEDYRDQSSYIEPQTNIEEETDAWDRLIGDSDADNTGVQVLSTAQNFKSGTADDSKMKQELRVLKAEVEKLKSAATEAETKAENDPTRANKSEATKKRNLANDIAERIAEIHRFQTETDTSRVKKQRKFNEKGVLPAGEGTAETKSQADRRHEERIEQAKKILQIPNQKEAIAETWNTNRKIFYTPSFDELTPEHQREWAATVLHAVDDKAVPDIPNQQRLMEDRINENYTEPKTEGKKVVKRRSKSDTVKSKPKPAVKSNRKKGTEKVRKPTIKEASAYAKEKLGPKWRTKHPRLPKLLRGEGKNLPAFNRLVDKYYAEEVITTQDELSTSRIEAIALVDEKGNAPTDRATMEGLFLKMLGPEVYNRIKHRIFYYETVKEAEKIHSRAASGSAVVTKSYRGHSPSGDRTYPGFRERGKKAFPDTMSFILENIPRGSELATFMHEIGSHIGLDNILSPRESTALVKKIRTWAQEYAQVGKGKANTEQTAAEEAIRQVEVLKMMRAVETTIPVNKDSRIVTEETTSEDHEIIAYFITNAVVLHGETKGRLGVIPQSTELGKVLHKFRLAFRKFIGYMKGETDNLNAQNIVDMAFGAAKLELDGGGYDIYHQGTIGAMDRYRRTFDYMELLRSAVPGGTVTPASKGISIPIYASGSSKEYAGEWNYDKLKAMTSYMTKSPWSDKIDAFVARRFPKNERGKYIHTSYLSKEEYIKFQKEQWAAEKKLRAGLKAEVAKRQRDAARHEKDMYDPDNISTEESYEIAPEEKKQSDIEANETRDWIRNKWGITATKIWDSLAELWRGGANSTKFLHQFINQVKKMMPAAKEWHRHILLSEKTRNEIKEVVDRIVVHARDMSEARLNKVNLFLAKSTIDQKWGYNPYEEGDPRFEKVVVDKKMRIAFNKLDKKQKDLVQEIFKHGIIMRARKQEIAERIFGKSDKFKRAKEEFFGASGLDGPYAPLRRFGSHVVELKSQELLDAEAVFAEKDSQINRDKMMVLKRQKKHYELSFHDSIANAKAKADANKGKFAYAVVSDKAKTITEGRAVDYNVLQKVLASLGAVDHNGEPILDPKSREYKAVVDMVNNMYLESLEDENARRSQVKREGFHGYEGNMVRSFVSHATAEANLIANMEHGKDINIALIEAKKSIKKDADGKLRDGNTITYLSKVYNMLVSHYSANLNSKPTPYQDRLAAMNTVYMLTSSIGYHITNATQPMMVTIPKLVGDFGVGNYTKALKLYYEGLKIASEVVTFNWKTLKLQTQIDLDNLSKEHKKYEPLLRELQLRQLLDVGMEQDLAEFNRSDSGFEIVNKATGKASSIAHRLYQVARMVEAYNRISTATAAFELAEANKAKVAKMGYYENSTEYAINMVEDTQGNFSAMDAPLVLKKAPKITGQYRKYQIMMAWVYADAFKKSFKGATPHEKAAGQRTMGLMVGHAALFSGMTGVPFASAISYLFMAMGEGEEPKDLERWIHENIEDETLATLIAHGLPSIFGIDMTTKLSQDKIFYPLPYTDFSTEDGKVQEMFFEAFAGPFGTTLTNFVRGYNFAKEGNAYRAMEYMLPKGARTAMESYRLGTEGYSLRNGDIITDDFSVWQLAVNAVGIPTTDIKHLKWKRGQQYELTEWFGDRQSEIRKKYVKAKKDRNNSKMKELRLEWAALQKSKDRVRPFFHDERSALKRTPISSLFKAPRGQEKREGKYRKQLGTD